MWFRKDLAEKPRMSSYKWVGTPTLERKEFEEELLSRLLDIPVERMTYTQGYVPIIYEEGIGRDLATGIGGYTDSGAHMVIFHEHKINYHNWYHIAVNDQVVATYKRIEKHPGQSWTRSSEEGFRAIQATYDFISRKYNEISIGRSEVERQKNEAERIKTAKRSDELLKETYKNTLRKL